MNYYEAEQLTRQRHDQFAKEASGARLMTSSRQSLASDQARGARAWTVNLRAVLDRSAKTILARISWLIGRLADIKDRPLRHQAITPRQP